MDKLLVDVFGAHGNYAIVRMPDRRNLGVVFQLDSIEGLIGNLEYAVHKVRSGDYDEALEELNSIKGQLDDLRAEVLAVEPRS